jgi:hypothetical protein
MTQEAIVLDHLRRKGSITRNEALMLHRIAHLPTRIFNLKARGTAIKSERHKDLTGHRYVRYSLA